jgi:hypothetical protein
VKRLLFLFLLASVRLSAATIVATGSWSMSLGTSDLLGGAGTNLPSTVTSTSSIITVDVTNAPLVGVYHVYARVSGTVPAGVTIWMQRTSDGSSFLNLGAITGGSAYQSLGGTDTEIFAGALDRYTIALQLKVTGVSVGITPATYQPNIILTVTP